MNAVVGFCFFFSLWQVICRKTLSLLASCAEDLDSCHVLIKDYRCLGSIQTVESAVCQCFSPTFLGFFVLSGPSQLGVGETFRICTWLLIVGHLPRRVFAASGQIKQTNQICGKEPKKKRLGSQTIEKHKNREAKKPSALCGRSSRRNRMRLSDILSRKVGFCLSRTQQLDLMKTNLRLILLRKEKHPHVFAFSSHALLRCKADLLISISSRQRLVSAGIHLPAAAAAAAEGPQSTKSPQRHLSRLHFDVQ